MVSIVIPTYNGARWLARTLDSVRAQTVDDWELIVVDDGSMDGSAALAATYARLDPRIRVVQQANGGIGAARNRGLSEANQRRPYVMFLDHDDCWTPDAIEILLARLETDDGAVAAIGGERFVDETGAQVVRADWAPRRLSIVDGRRVSNQVGMPITFNLLVCENCIWSPGQALYRREMINAIGGFDPATAPCDDWDLHIRLSLHGYLATVDRVVLLSRQHDANTSRNTDLMLSTKLKVYRKLILDRSLDAQRRGTMLSAIRYLHLEAAARRVRWACADFANCRPFQAAKQARHVALSCIGALWPERI